MLVKVEAVLGLADVVREVPWNISLSSACFVELVHQKLANNELAQKHFQEFIKDPDASKCWDDYHAARVAFFVRHGWTEPILIDVGIPGLTGSVWPIDDGNHRLYAAYVRGDTEIEAELQGSVAELERHFGQNCCP